MKKGLMKKITNFIINCLITVVFIVLSLIIYIKADMIITGKNYFSFGGYSVFCVVTGSMEPVISIDDVVIVKKQDKYVVDDIITYIKEDNFITHRIVSLNDENITTKGDNNSAIDVAVDYDNVIGKVVKIYDNLGTWQNILSNPYIIIAIFVTLVLFDLAFSYKGDTAEEEVKTRGRKKKKKEYEYSIEDLEKIVDEMAKRERNKKLEIKKEDNEKLDYTVRLDLSKLQENIDSKMNE